VAKKITAAIVMITAPIILIFSCYSLYIDLNYFVTKKQAVCTILRVSDYDNGQLMNIKLNYFNAYTRKITTCEVNLEISYRSEFVKSDQKGTTIFYSKFYPQKVFLSRYKSPHFAIVFFDLLLIILMCIAISSVMGGVGNVTR
jgi:hypothetical protein